MTENQNNEVKTLRLADVLLFAKNRTFEGDINLLCDDTLKITCEGRQPITQEKGKYLRVNAYGVWKSLVRGDPNHVSDIKNTKKVISSIFNAWCIDIEKVSSSIERNYPKYRNEPEGGRSDGSNRCWNALYKEIHSLMLYYQKYGPDALRVSAHRWLFKDTCLPFIVDQEIYEKGGKAADYESMLKKKEVELNEEKERTRQEYLTLKVGELLTFGSTCTVTFKNLETSVGCTDVDIRTKVVELPPFSQIVDGAGHVVMKNNKGVQAFWLAPKSMFRWYDRTRASDNVYIFQNGESFEEFRKRSQLFKEFLCAQSQDKYDLFCRCVERRFSYNRSSCSDTDFQQDQQDDCMYKWIAAGSLGVSYRMGWQNEELYKKIDAFVTKLVNEQKNYEALPKIRQQDYDRMSEKERRHFREAHRWDQAPQQGITVRSHQPQICETQTKGGEQIQIGN